MRAITVTAIAGALCGAADIAFASVSTPARFASVTVAAAATVWPLIALGCVRETGKWMDLADRWQDVADRWMRLRGPGPWEGPPGG